MIKLIAWDVYGTLIATGSDEIRDDRESEPLFLRRGVKEVLDYLDSLSCFQITYSDGDLGNQKTNLKKAGIDWTEHFFDLYQLTPNRPKDPQIILDHFGLKSSELVVIGDNWKIDILPALRKRCHAIHVPEYETYCVYDKIMKSGILS